MGKLWATHGQGEEKQQVNTPLLGADDGIRTRDPHLGKGAWFVHCSPLWFILTCQRGLRLRRLQRTLLNRDEQRPIGAKFGASFRLGGFFQFLKAAS
jgi:hypothetical protein